MERRRGPHRHGVAGGLFRIHRRWMDGPRLQSRARRPGSAPPGLRARRGDLERRQRLLHPLSHAHARGHRGPRALRVRGAEGDVPPQADQRRVGRHDGPHRAAGRLRPRGRAHARRPAAGRRLSPRGPEDLHHLRRARPDRERRPSRAGADAHRASRREGHLALRGAEVPRQRRRDPGGAQRHPLRVAGAQARHPRQPDGRAGAGRQGGRGRLAGRRGEPRHRVHVHHDERRALRGRTAGNRAVGARLPAGALVRARAGPGLGAGLEEPRGRGHRPAPRRAPDAPADEVADRGDARGRLRGRRRDGHRPVPPGRGAPRREPGLRRFS